VVARTVARYRRGAPRAGELDVKLHSLGYVGLSTAKLDDWTTYANRFLGMQLATSSPHERTEGPSLWGHDRQWPTPNAYERARDLRIRHAAEGTRVPLNVMEGNFAKAADVCPWWNATVRARKAG
jgi:hypothetical protein